VFVPKLLLRDLVAVEERVEVAPGVMLPVKPLTLKQIIQLVLIYKEAAIMLYNEATKSEPNYPSVLAAVPSLVADVICMGTGTEGQEKDASSMPPGTQLQLIAAIWELSVPDAKKLIESLSKLMGQVQRLAEAASMPVAVQGLTQSDSAGQPSNTSTTTSPR
jgi:hypothetical protein